MAVTQIARPASEPVALDTPDTHADRGANINTRMAETTMAKQDGVCTPDVHIGIYEDQECTPHDIVHSNANEDQECTPHVHSKANEDQELTKSVHYMCTVRQMKTKCAHQTCTQRYTKTESAPHTCTWSGEMCRCDLTRGRISQDVLQMNALAIGLRRMASPQKKTEMCQCN